MFISVSSQTTLIDSSNFFVFALYDASNPTVLLESQAPPKPYGNPLQISFLYNCLNGKIYIIKLWESPDSTATGFIRNSFSQSINSNQVSVLIKGDEYLEADITAGLVSGTTGYVNTDWVNWDYSIERIGQGTMVPDFTDNTDPNYHKDATGGFTLIQPDDEFQPQEKFVVRFEVQVIPNLGGDPSPIFGSGRVITADETLTNADTGQALLIQSATNKITLTLPALTTIADFSFMYFYSAGGSHTNAVFTLPGTDKFLYNGSLRSQLILGQSEVLKIFKAFGVWNVDNDLFGVKMVGELLYNYSLININAIICNGTLLLRNQYPRLWEWVQQLASGVVVSDSAWLSTFSTVDGVTYFTKQGCFSAGDGSTNFRLPLITKYFIRPVDGMARIAGSLELQTLQSHHHFNGVADDTTDLFVYPATTDDIPGDAIRSVQSETNPRTFQGQTSNTGDPETKPSNIAAYAMIRI